MYAEGDTEAIIVSIDMSGLLIWCSFLSFGFKIEADEKLTAPEEL